MVNRLLLFLWLLCLAATANATDVHFDISKFNASPVGNRIVTLQPQQPVLGNIITNVTADDGTFTYSNAKVADYFVSIRAQGSQAKIDFQITVTATNLGTVEADTITSQLGIQTYPTSGKSSWTIEAADQRYQFSGTVLSNTFYPLFSNPSNYVSVAVLASSNLAPLSVTNQLVNTNQLTATSNALQAQIVSGAVTLLQVTNVTTNLIASATNGLTTLAQVNTTSNSVVGTAQTIANTTSNLLNGQINTSSNLVFGNAVTQINTTSNTLYSDYTTKIALSLTNAFATNVAGVSYASGRVYISTNYDALGAASAVQVNLNNVSNYVAGVSNNVITATNSLYSTLNSKKVDTISGVASNLFIGGDASFFNQPDDAALKIVLTNANPNGMSISMTASTNEVTAAGIHIQTPNTNYIGAQALDFGLWSPGFGPDYSGSAVIDLYNTNAGASSATSNLPPNFVVNVTDARDGGVVTHPIFGVNGTNLNFELYYKTNGSRTKMPGFVWDGTLGLKSFRQVPSTNLAPSGTVSSSGRTITGSGTLFGNSIFSELGFGDALNVGVGVYPIKSISSSTSATSSEPLGAFSGSPYGIYRAAVRWYSIDGVTPVAAIGADGTLMVKRSGDGAWLRLIGNTKDYQLAEGGSGEFVIHNSSDNANPFLMTPGGNLTLGGSITAVGSGLTGIPAGAISTNGSTANQVLTSVGGVTVWTNGAVALGALTNAIGTNFPNGKLVNQTLFYPTNDISVTSNALQVQIATKAETNSPTIFTPTIRGGSAFLLTNGNTYFSGGGTADSLVANGLLGLTISPFVSGGGVVTVTGTVLATNGFTAGLGGRFIGNGSGLTNTSSTNISGTGLIQVTNIASSLIGASVGITNAVGTNFPNGNVANQILYYPTNFVNPTNGFATGLSSTNTALLGNVSFGADGTDTNILSGNGTNYIGFYNAGSAQATNGCFKWMGSLNCYSNTVTAAILTNNSTAWLLQTNGVTLYSLSGANPIGTYTAVSGALPAPFSVRGFALDLNRMFLEGYLSAQNIQILSNTITTNITLTTTNNFIANLNGFGTNTTLTNAMLGFTKAAWGDGNSIDSFSGGGAVLAGSANSISVGPNSIIPGGNRNAIAGGTGAVISGGKSNVTTSADYAVISGGLFNTLSLANDHYSVISGGKNNDMQNAGQSAIIGGEFNQITSSSSASWSAVLGGQSNKVSSLYSVAFGHNAVATSNNVVVWSDGTTNASTPSLTNSQFKINATNGLYLNGPLWLGVANTNAGIFYRSNTFSIWAVTNSWGVGDVWHGNSNGVPVELWNSNGVPVMKNDFP